MLRVKQLRRLNLHQIIRPHLCGSLPDICQRKQTSLSSRKQSCLILRGRVLEITENPALKKGIRWFIVTNGVSRRCQRSATSSLRAFEKSRITITFVCIHFCDLPKHSFGKADCRNILFCSLRIALTFHSLYMQGIIFSLLLGFHQLPIVLSSH